MSFETKYATNIIALIIINLHAFNIRKEVKNVESNKLIILHNKLISSGIAF